MEPMLANSARLVYKVGGSPGELSLSVDLVRNHQAANDEARLARMIVASPKTRVSRYMTSDWPAATPRIDSERDTTKWRSPP